MPSNYGQFIRLSGDGFPDALERTQVWFHGEGRLLKRTRFILQLNAPLYRPSRPVHILTSVGEEKLDRVLPHGADAHAAKFDSAENS